MIATAAIAQATRARIRLDQELGRVASGDRDSEALERAALEFKGTTSSTGTSDSVSGFVATVASLVHAVRWAEAVWAAEAHSERHRDAARLRASETRDQAVTLWPPDLTEAVEVLANLNEVNHAAQAAELLMRVPVPPRLSDLVQAITPVVPHRDASMPRTAKPHVALLFRFQGEPVLRPTVLQPGALHQLEVEARVASWPEGAEVLRLTFLSVHPRDFVYVSDVTFREDALVQPLEIRLAGERPASDPPIGITALATFEGGEKDVASVLTGNTTLELVTFDPGTALPVNMPATARRLLQMMSQLGNALPDLPAADRRDARLLLEGQLRFAHTLLDDRLELQPDVDEAWFQRELRMFLQADPTIGARLEERVGRAGGITDLGLGNIVLELKVEKATPTSFDRVQGQFAEQPTQYASARDSQVSLLGVLDVSAKRAPAGVMGNEIGWAFPETTSGPNAPLPSMVGVVVMRAGFPRPSDFSR